MDPANELPQLEALPTFPLKPRDIGFIAAFWLAFAILRVADRVFAEATLIDFGRRILPAAGESLCWIVFTPIVFALAESTLRSARYRILLLSTLTALGVIGALVVSAVGSWLRLSDLVMPGRQTRVLSPPYWFWLGDALSTYLGVLAAGLARGHLLHSRERQVRATELAGQLVKSQLDALRRQLDPHFLFNTLSLITALVEPDPVGARRMIARLSDLLRASLRDGEARDVPLSEELALLDVYLDIMRVRFEGRLTVTRTIAPSALHALVPPLVLQPLVENAIKHGVEKLSGPGHLGFTATIAGDDLIMTVRDNGQENGWMNGDAAPYHVAKNGIGLANTVERLSRLYGPGNRLVVRPAEGGGTESILRIPYRPMP